MRALTLGVWATLFCLLFGAACMARDVAIIGPTFPIQEQALDKVMQRQFKVLQQSGQLKQKIQPSLREASTMAPVQGVTTTQNPTLFLVTPTIKVPRPVLTPQGQVRFAKNKKTNVLATTPLNETLLFYDARDPDQVCWAQKINQKIKGRKKFILVGGNWQQQGQQLQQKVYIDTGGRLIHALHIQHVPAIVTQQGDRLAIREVRPCQN